MHAASSGTTLGSSCRPSPSCSAPSRPSSASSRTRRVSTSLVLHWACRRGASSLCVLFPVGASGGRRAGSERSERPLRGLFPDVPRLLQGIVFVLSCFYPRKMRTMRVSLFFGGAALAGAFGGASPFLFGPFPPSALSLPHPPEPFLSPLCPSRRRAGGAATDVSPATGIIGWGVGHANGGGLPSWGWLFASEGIFTVLVGISAYWWVPSGVRGAKVRSCPSSAFSNAV